MWGYFNHCQHWADKFINRRKDNNEHSEEGKNSPGRHEHGNMIHYYIIKDNHL